MCPMLVDEAVRPFHISQILFQLTANVLGEVIFEYLTFDKLYMECMSP
jgi:hypothetical protein